MVIQPKCPVFGKCGGCAYQDTEYSLQLEIKKKEAAEIFRGLGLKMPPGLKIFFKQPYYYRNRMDFVFSEGGPGFREKGKFNSIVNFEKCHISNAGINYALSKVIEWYNERKEKISVFDVEKNKGALRYSVIRSSFFSKQTSVTFILNKDSEEIEKHRVLIQEFASANKNLNVLAGCVKHNTDVSATNEYEVVNGDDYIYENLGENRFYYHTQGFFQNNSPVMMDIVFYISGLIRGRYDNLVDLYGGVGTFGIFFAGAAGEVFIIDNDKNSFGCAKRNIEENNITNAAAYNVDAKALEEFGEDFVGKKNIFILDPPRAGLHKKTVKFIKKIKPEKIIYVSCNPRQLAQDLKKLIPVYETGEYAMFDMFPQTRHVESVMELKLKKGDKDGAD